MSSDKIQWNQNAFRLSQMFHYYVTLVNVSSFFTRLRSNWTFYWNICLCLSSFCLNRPLRQITWNFHLYIFPDEKKNDSSQNSILHLFQMQICCVCTRKKKQIYVKKITATYFAYIFIGLIYEKIPEVVGFYCTCVIDIGS